ncbi:MAG: ABC transporter ATP-binding protein [Deltaproteobacteria bacterium]|nr:MAG: ABC transporter ATP-binding protein [Deltaproteobacteria bacterium]
MIEIRKLTKMYRDLKAVDNISFTIERGEILGFLGPNGAGKTTTMRMITGYLSPSYGAVYVDGLNVFDEPLVVKKKIGYLPETPPVYMDMTVESYLKFVAELKGLPYRTLATEIGRVSDRCGISHNSHRLIRHLSKGYRQRVGLAQALLGSPSVLILDEPTVGLDPAQMREVRGLIKELAQEHTVILSTHILPEVEMICNRVSIIHKGKIVASDTIENLSRGMGDEARVRVELSEPNTEAKAKLLALDGVENVEEKKADVRFDLTLASHELANGPLLQTLAASDLSVRECFNVTPTLEDIFLRAVSGRELGVETTPATPSAPAAPAKKEEPKAKAVEAKEEEQASAEAEEASEEKADESQSAKASNDSKTSNPTKKSESNESQSSKKSKKSKKRKKR